jgi:hypothetical protein
VSRDPSLDPEDFLGWVFVVAISLFGAFVLGALILFAIHTWSIAGDKRECRNTGRLVVLNVGEETEWHCARPTAESRP